MSRLCLCFALSFAILLNPNGLPDSAFAAPLLLQDSQSTSIKNGSFSDWDNDRPVGWEIQIGANNGGNSPASTVQQGEGPSLELSGNRKTTAWNMVSQTIDVEPQQSVRFSYSAKAVGIKREGRQFDNCYVGIFFKTDNGKKISPRVWPVLQEKFTNESHMFRVPDKVNQIDIVIFLSKTGTLNVTGLKLKVLDPDQSFDLLVEDMGRNYSYFELKKINWEQLADRYRERATTAGTPADFAKVVKEMLGELKDVHTWIIHNDQKQYVFSSRYSGNYNFPWLGKQLAKQQKIGSFGVVGRTKDGFGYVRINTLSGVDNQQIQKMIQRISQTFDAPGLILDLRRNGGGAEPIAAAIAGMFTDEQLVYGRQAFRSGSGRDEFRETPPRVLRPTQGKKFDGPVVCLIGPGVVSSAEGFAMMMKAIPNCTLIGLSTRGASGNPAPVELPNGVDVWYSRWKSLLPDGTPIEDVGIQPDIEVQHDPKTDPAFQKAVEFLSSAVKSKEAP